jgi:hypothetical protein
MLIQLIEAAVEKDEAAASSFRTHLGASQIGRPCDRELWYAFRWAGDRKFPGRVLRLFARGKREEDVFIGLLTKIGIKVSDEQAKISDVDGHFGGSMDAILSCLPGFETQIEAVLECKTANEKSFRNIELLKVQKGAPEHYAQMQVYMGGINIKLALYMVVNKNTDELYTEWVPYNATVGENLIKRARHIIYAPQPLNRINNSASWYQCRFCEYRPQCHFGEPMKRNCRTCVHSRPGPNASWLCGLHSDAKIPVAFQLKGCDNYKPITD